MNSRKTLLSVLILFVFASLMAFPSLASEQPKLDLHLGEVLSSISYAPLGFAGGATAGFFATWAFKPNLLELSTDKQEDIETFTKLGNVILAGSALGTAAGAAWGISLAAKDHGKSVNVLSSFSVALALEFGTYLLINKGQLQREPEVAENGSVVISFEPEHFLAIFTATILGSIIGANAF